MAKITSSYGLNNPLQETFPVPIIALRDPTANDINYELGQVWINKTSADFFALGSVVAGVATWTSLSSGTSMVNTLSGDTGGDLNPTAGNLVLAGGTNINTAGSASTIDFNLDDAIALATSVTAPLYTAGAGVPLTLIAPSGQNTLVTLGDAAGAEKLSIRSSTPAEVASIDSAGKATVKALTAAGVVLLNNSNNANSSINTGTSTGVVAIGNSLAGAVTVTSGSTIGLVGTSAINASNNANTTINTGTSTGTVGIGNASAGSVTVTSGGTIGLVGTTAVNASNNANTTINTGSSTGTVGIGNASAGSVTITSGGTIGAIGTTAINASHNFNTTINTGNSTGTIGIGNAAAGAITVATAAGVGIDAATASHMTVTGATVDLTLSSVGGSVNVTATEAISDAIVLNASDAAGGVQLKAGSAGTQVFGNLILSNVATQLQINGGAVTDFIGQATLGTGTGTVDVANTNIAAGDRIFVTRSSLNGSTGLGELVTTITPSTKFTITSISVTDGSTIITADKSIVDYVIIRQF